MATPADRARLALALPEVTGEGVNFGVGKGDQLGLPRPRQTEGEARDRAGRRRRPLRYRVEGDADRGRAGSLFDDDHYRGYPAVLVRLDAVDIDELQGLLEAAWRIQAPRRLTKDRP